MKRNKVIIYSALLILGFMLSVSLASSEEASVCCEKTTSNLYCQQVASSQCIAGSRQAPTSCESTSFCKPGVCYSPLEGSCLENTPQVVCNARNATWSAVFPKQCELGCCVLGDQAAFVSLVRCKRLASFLGLPVNYNTKINNEAACILSVQNQDKGACVYEFEFEKTCKFTTREICSSGANGTRGNFYKDKLCSAPELGTVCERTKNTMCVPGKEEVYFADSCGNRGNVYDASKISDAAYWTNVIPAEQSCNPGSSNSNSKTCGNCNYLGGSICRDAEKGSKAQYGNFICADLNCKNTQNGKPYKHGESWCVYNDKGETGKGKNAVGGRFYKHTCINGEETLEQCADFRQEECIQEESKTALGTFSQAACRVNRWQDCTAQNEQKTCENRDRRDCIWKENVCLPMNPPGLQFWQGEETKKICAQGNAQCIVVFEKGLFGGEECKSGCECLTSNWLAQHTNVCNGLGDCGPNSNWLGQDGYTEGFKLIKEKA